MISDPTCVNCGVYGEDVRVIDGISDDPVCSRCYHLIIAEDLERDAACSPDRERIAVLVARLRQTWRKRDADELAALVVVASARWADEHARAWCALCAAWQECIRLGPRA